MFRHALAVLLVGGMILGVVGCGDKKPEPKANPDVKLDLKERPSPGGAGGGTPAKGSSGGTSVK